MNFRISIRSRNPFFGFVCLLAHWANVFADPPLAGPQTESRFPPLTVPAGFNVTLFACDPLIEYPSVIALGPRAGTVFVAHDYVTGLGFDIVKRDEIRLVEDTDGDGYADKSTLFAGEFNSIQGLATSGDTVFAMHAPVLTALRDTNGDGVADERHDLLNGLGLTPEKNTTRLHCANGVAVGHDGWLYLAMGDNGTDVMRPEGDRLVLNGGGILRCRPDGRALHVFATGLRNIYDIALDGELNVFVRDNENDGGDYMIRVCHSFHGADHGYPYLYAERPHEALAPLADLGRGSSAGGVCYLETAFPPEYRGNLFFCEWGKSIVRYERKPSGSSFAPMKEIEFATAAPNDPYGLKPTDIIVDRDGSLLIADWGDGQRPKRGRGRIYRIAAESAEIASAKLPAIVTPQDAIVALNSESYLRRVEAQAQLERLDAAELWKVIEQHPNNSSVARMHLVWIMARQSGLEATKDLFLLADFNTDSRARIQAVRAISDLFDPVLNHRSVDGADPTRPARRLSQLRIKDDPRLLMEIVVALGRLRWSGAPQWLRDHIGIPDAALTHAAMQTLRRSDTWPGVLALLDEPTMSPMTPIALMAIAERADPVIVDGVIARLKSANDPRWRAQLAEALSRVYKQPGPWKYWGYRPAPRPANTESWERTEAIAAALDRVLTDPDHDVRTATLRRMQREQIPVPLGTLDRWLREERAAEPLRAILDSLAKLPADESRELLAAVLVQPDDPPESRRAALSMFVSGLTAANEHRLLEVAKQIEDGPVLVDLLTELAKRPSLDSDVLLLAKLSSQLAEVRAAALMTSANRKVTEAARHVVPFLNDGDARVRRAAAAAAGLLDVKEATMLLLPLARDADPAIRGLSLDSLRQLHEPSAVAAAIDALEHPQSQLAAIEYLAEFGGPEHAAVLTTVTTTSRSQDVLTAVVRSLANWQTRTPTDSPPYRKLATTLANVQGRSGVLWHWRVIGPLDRSRLGIPVRPDDATDTKSTPAVNIDAILKVIESEDRTAKTLIASGAESRVELPPRRLGTPARPESTKDSQLATDSQSESNSTGKSAHPTGVWLAVSELRLAEPTRLQFLASSNSPLQLILNGKSVFQRDKSGTFQPDFDRIEADVPAGLSRIVVQLEAAKPATFHVRFRPLSSSAEHERLTQFALQNTGNADRGRELFFNADKSLCAKCHKLNDQGGQIGPNLTGVGDRFSRIHLIESILDPSRTIAPSYETISVELASGRVLNGVKVAEDQVTLSLGDDKGQRHDILKSEIESRTTQRRSTMPDGLEKRFTDREFLDLMTFLTSEKKPAGR